MNAIAAEVCGVPQPELRRDLPHRIQLDPAAVTPIDIAPERQPDVGELAGRSDLVMKLHGVDVRGDRGVVRAVVPAGLDVEKALGPYGVQIVRNRGVVFTLKEIVTRRLARRQTD